MRITLFLGAVLLSLFIRGNSVLANCQTSESSANNILCEFHPSVRIQQQSEERKRINAQSPAFEWRLGDREKLIRRAGGNQDTERAVLAGLLWLARHQSPEGYWKASGFSAQCAGEKCTGFGQQEYDVGVTALALLAFLGAGYTHASLVVCSDPTNPGRMLKYGEIVKNGINWLMMRQDYEGCVGGRNSDKYMYNHIIASLALSEAYGMTASEIIKPCAQKAIDFMSAAQNPGKAWRYSFRCGDNDSSVTGWCVMVLRAAELSRLNVPKSCYDGALNHYDDATVEENGFVGYIYKGSTGHPIGEKAKYHWHPAMPALGILSRILIKNDRSDLAAKSTRLILGDLPVWEPYKIDYSYWFYGSNAIFQYDGPDGDSWKKWNVSLKGVLLTNQKTVKDGCQGGSWDPAVEYWSNEGGRVYSVAINTLSLETYYRYPILSRPPERK